MPWCYFYALKILCQRSLMEWSRCWGFTKCSSLSEFMPSLSLVSWHLFCCCVVLCCAVLLLCCCSSSWTSCNSHLFFSLFNISFLITYQKKNNSKENFWYVVLFYWQLDHRILATATLISIGTLWWSTRKLDIHPAVKSLIGSTVGMAALQVIVCLFSFLTFLLSFV